MSRMRLSEQRQAEGDFGVPYFRHVYERLVPVKTAAALVALGLVASACGSRAEVSGSASTTSSVVV